MKTMKFQNAKAHADAPKAKTTWVPHADRIDLKTVPSLMETKAASWAKS